MIVLFPPMMRTVLVTSQQGRITLTNLVLDDIFLVSFNVINVLKTSLKIFESTGSTCVKGKNIFFITIQLHAAWISQDEVGKLPDET